jgi:membrane associated rhomboid family serine protease
MLLKDLKTAGEDRGNRSRAMVATAAQLEETGSMRGRYPAPAGVGFSFGPGGITPAIKVLIAANVAAFVISWFAPEIILFFGLRIADVIGSLRIWQPITYMFLHGGFGHILFNMLALWMFGVELERMWGTRFFLKYYFVCGLGAAATTAILSFLPFAVFDHLYAALTVGASGAIYGILLAYGLYFPNRPIYIYFVFPVPAKYFVMIMGGIALLSSLGGSGGVAHTAHLGGLVVGYLYLKGGRLHLASELQYRFLKWRINRMRRRFDVYSGGRANDVDRRVH